METWSVAAAFAAQHGLSSAAVRHWVMADITLSWARLRWPRWASRQAGPCSRKMSATSNRPPHGVRLTTRRQLLQRADHLAQSRSVATWA